MMDVNSGYVGWSMSRRAADAYATGEMPKSKWTKKMIVEALKGACDDLDLMYDPSVERMCKEELFSRFLRYSSWHHTSKFFNETDFYAIDEREIEDTFRPMTDDEISEKKAEREALRSERSKQLAEQRTKEAITAEKRAAYHALHGFWPDTVAAFAHEHPECCHERISRKGRLLLCYPDYMGREQACPLDCLDRQKIIGFDATEPNSFKSVIDRYQSKAANGITLKGEMEAMCAASSKMADIMVQCNRGQAAR